MSNDDLSSMTVTSVMVFVSILGLRPLIFTAAKILQSDYAV